MTTMASHKAPERFREFTLQDNEGPIILYGEILADLSWDYDTAFERGHTRWTDITLYRNRAPESSYPYVIQVVGRSVVYHRRGGCRSGVSVPVGRLRSDVERFNNLAACAEVGCMPADLEDMQDNDIVNAEEDIFTLHKCESAEDVVRVMQNRGGRGTMSGLNVKLLQAAARGDRAIAAAMAPKTPRRV